jgi:glucoamylase
VAGGLLAIGDHAAVERAVHFLIATQEADGHWAQNMWLDGTAHWTGVQMDETAFPILLVGLARERGALSDGLSSRCWPMVRQAAAYLVRNGPVTAQDRWEEDGGYSPFTLAAEIAALVTAAEDAERAGEPGMARYLRETASAWDASIERWCYVEDTELARDIGVGGYYVRIAPPDVSDADTAAKGWIPIKNRPPGEGTLPAREVVSPDALALVRFGLRSFDDPRIENTVRVVDARLRVDFPGGLGWHRYTEDGYGEHEDGSPFDGTGVGRVWPLLTGERGHFAVAAGRLDEARSLLDSMRAMSGRGGLLPEQIWDSADIPERELFFGSASGSALPLAWAHAEYLKLARSIQEGAVFDLPGAVRRWSRDRVHRIFWKATYKARSIPAGWRLRVERPVAGRVRWSVEEGSVWLEGETLDSGLGVHFVDILTDTLAVGARVRIVPDPESASATEFELEVVEASASLQARR